jgi:hypothetical protein
MHPSAIDSAILVAGRYFSSYPTNPVPRLLALAHGFDPTMIAGLVDEGLAEASRSEIRHGPSRTTIEVVRIGISDAASRSLQLST